ncbi:serine/threonine-protein kinase [Bacillus thuringiensis]|uniref:serine/threonine-protein kinase n=1 Tax=Bacillus thuringiensis TaxID=1428 RepID=UPI000BEBF7FB|nr:serine/threonine-protein kinase [Bacillus thuringiensis]PDY30967.1 serine/threonine protein kinase [Bacillus thuringiensis]
MGSQDERIFDYLESNLINYLAIYGMNNPEPNRFTMCYEDISYPLCRIFSTLHPYINKKFKNFYTGIFNDTFSSSEAYRFMQLIDELEELQGTLQNTKYSFDLIPSYKDAIVEVKDYLSLFGENRELLQNGYPPTFSHKVTLEEVNPVFQLKSTISTSNSGIAIPSEMKLIGEGSYAKVHKYKDNFYNRFFAVKAAHKELNTDELMRFRREFNEMKKLKSPYVLEVYNFDDEKQRYIMEYADFSLYNFIKKNNNTLSVSKRIDLTQQIFKAFTYIHSKGILHRDISPSNILIKTYEHTEIIKISDFGLVKIPDSQLTNPLTEVKGSYRDPNLELVGFDKYQLHNEIYSLTWVIYYTLTGRKEVRSIKSNQFKAFIEKGMNPDIHKRYKDVKEMQDAFNELIHPSQKVGV